ncbi:hypothetical protein ACR2XG_28705, partial [Klebsiella pneumoniae]
GIRISMGRTASTPYAKEKGVTPIEHRIEVQYAYKVRGNLSAQSLCVSIIFYRMTLIFLLAASTAPLVLALPDSPKMTSSIGSINVLGED